MVVWLEIADEEEMELGIVLPKLVIVCERVEVPV